MNRHPSLASRHVEPAWHRVTAASASAVAAGSTQPGDQERRDEEADDVDVDGQRLLEWRKKRSASTWDEDSRRRGQPGEQQGGGQDGAVGGGERRRVGRGQLVGRRPGWGPTPPWPASTSASAARGRATPRTAPATLCTNGMRRRSAPRPMSQTTMTFLRSHRSRSAVANAPKKKPGSRRADSTAPTATSALDLPMLAGQRGDGEEPDPVTGRRDHLGGEQPAVGAGEELALPFDRRRRRPMALDVARSADLRLRHCSGYPRRLGPPAAQGTPSWPCVRWPLLGTPSSPSSALRLRPPSRRPASSAGPPRGGSGGARRPAPG